MPDLSGAHSCACREARSSAIPKHVAPAPRSCPLLNKVHRCWADPEHGPISTLTPLLPIVRHWPPTPVIALSVRIVQRCDNDPLQAARTTAVPLAELPPSVSTQRPPGSTSGPVPPGNFSITYSRWM